MYYIVYGILYVFSLLPYSILYVISDGFYALLFYVIRYRRKIVDNNLLLAFPNKTEVERNRIAKQFYKHFTDSFMEMLKVLSVSDKTFDKRCVADFTVINELVAKGKKIQFFGGHFFNWEYTNLFLAKHAAVPFFGYYAKIENKVFNRLMYKVRTKYGTVALPTSGFSRELHKVMQQQFEMLLFADQTPGLPHLAYWINFFGKAVPFGANSPNMAVKNNTTIIFLNCKKVKRGYYEFVCEEVVEDCGQYSPEKITLMYRDFLEKCIRQNPDNYLWTHRRWKYDFEEYKPYIKYKWIEG